MRHSKYKVKHRDRVKHPSIPNKVFTVRLDNEVAYLYQCDPSLMFDLSGVCVNSPRNSPIEEGTKLEFYKADKEYKKPRR
jgi:hypothetical protein